MLVRIKITQKTKKLSFHLKMPILFMRKLNSFKEANDAYAEQEKRHRQKEIYLLLDKKISQKTTAQEILDEALQLRHLGRSYYNESIAKFKHTMELDMSFSGVACKEIREMYVEISKHNLFKKK